MPRAPQSKIIPFDQLSDLSRRLHARGAKIVSTNGCFDLLHAGHCKYLGEARELGDVLVVGVNSDRSVRKLKGEQRPICSELERATLLASLEAIDYVVIFDEDTPERFLGLLRPTVHTKGGDYDGRDLPEARTVEKGGGSIKFLPFSAGFSTTKILEKILASEVLAEEKGSGRV